MEVKITGDQATAMIILEQKRKEVIAEILSIDRAMVAVAQAITGCDGTVFNLDQREGQFYIHIGESEEPTKA